jgi:hypothetical protein
VLDHGRFIVNAGKKQEYALSQDFDFYYDMAANRLYLYLSAGNPGELYEDIEVITKQTALKHDASQPGHELYDPVIIENLCIKYANFGIAATFVHSLVIRGCEIGFIGGCLQNRTVRFGNGIEIFNTIHYLVVENNWIYQCYDAGYTNQGHVGEHKNITVRNNLIEYCNYNIEAFVRPSAGGKFINTVYEDNILRFAGFGFGSYNRIGSDCSMASHVCSWRGAQPSEDFIVRNNIFDTSAYQLISSGFSDGVNGPVYVGNTWAQKKNANDYVIYTRLDASEEKASYLTATDQASMESTVDLVDKTATVIYKD